MRYRVWRAGAHRQQVPALPYEKYPLGESDKPRKARAIRLIRSKTAPHAAHPVRRSLGSIQGCRRSPTRGQRCPPRHVPPLLPPVRVQLPATRHCASLYIGGVWIRQPKELEMKRLLGLLLVLGMVGCGGNR